MKKIITIEVDIPEEKTFCELCGRPFDSDDYQKTMAEQTEGMRTDCYKTSQTKYCGLFCSWLSQPDMIKNLQERGKYQTTYQTRKYNNMAKMRDYIAKRVAEYLIQNEK